MKVIAWDKSLDIAIVPERMPIKGEWACFVDGKKISKKQYNEPAEPEPEKPIRSISKRAFMRRISQLDRIAIRNSTDDIVIDIHEDLKIASKVDLDDDDTTAGVGYLISKNLLLNTNVDILFNDGTEAERYP